MVFKNMMYDACKQYLESVIDRDANDSLLNKKASSIHTLKYCFFRFFGDWSESSNQDFAHNNQGLTIV